MKWHHYLNIWMNSTSARSFYLESGLYLTDSIPVLRKSWSQNHVYRRISANVNKFFQPEVKADEERTLAVSTVGTLESMQGRSERHRNGVRIFHRSDTTFEPKIDVVLCANDLQHQFGQDVGALIKRPLAHAATGISQSCLKKYIFNIVIYSWGFFLQNQIFKNISISQETNWFLTRFL